jgi:hypothetical protein
MPRTTNIFRSFIGGSLAAFAALLVAAPSAFALHYGPHALPPNYAGPSQFGPHDPWYQYGLSLTQERQLDARHQALIQNLQAQSATQSAPTFTTDTMAPGGGTQQAPAVHFVTDTMAPGGGDTTTVVSTGDTFDWGSAGIGAGIAIGAVLLASAAAAATMRRRSRLAI